uniref:Uncharacterized protein n=1 Tax=Anopheles christyi TaxID=43041 RepID=A0A182KHV0_9DIPT
MLYDTAQAVTVRCDDNVLALLQLGNDNVVPVRQCTRDRQLQRFGHRELVRFRVVLVSLVLDDGIIVSMVRFHVWRWDIEAATPDQHLFFTVLGGRLARFLQDRIERDLGTG